MNYSTNETQLINIIKITISNLKKKTSFIKYITNNKSENLNI